MLDKDKHKKRENVSFSCSCACSYFLHIHTGIFLRLCLLVCVFVFHKCEPGLRCIHIWVYVISDKQFPSVEPLTLNMVDCLIVFLKKVLL